MLHVLLDNVEIEVPEGLTILQVCTLSNFDLPRFCYHERLSIAGNCRMCLVETNISKKLVIACATPVVDKMIILIDSLRVRKSRESVLEFLLSNHPLDCPICDQGGECDLQDLTFLYGSDRGRFYELSKRSVGFKYFGLFVKTFMTRCIHCTRCVRFLVEVCGFFELGLVSRGVLMEISTYVNGWIEHELGGNIIDLCPVGALTSKYFSFVGRSWECFSIESLDLLDGFCSPIRFDIIGNKVVRVLPAINVLLNEEWITNKIRFFYDSLYLQRIVFPLVNFSYFFSVLRVYCSVSWEFVFRLLGFFFFKMVRLTLFFGSFFDFYSLLKLKELFLGLGLRFFFSLNVDFRLFFVRSFLFSFFNLFLVICLVGVNTRLEGPLFNSRLRRVLFSRVLNVFLFGLGLRVDFLTFSFFNVLNSFFFFLRVVENLGVRFFSLFCSLFVFGLSVFLRSDYFNFWFLFSYLFFFNLLWVFIYYSFVFLHFFELGFFFYFLFGQFFCYGEKSLFLFFGFDEVWDFRRFLQSFIVYQGSHGDFVARFATLILPVKTAFEVTGLFLNTLGFWSRIGQVFDLSLFLHSDVEVFYNVCAYFKSFMYLNFPLQVYLSVFSFISWGYFFPALNFFDFGVLLLIFLFFVFFFDSLFFSCVFNYYLTDIFCRSSRILIECSDKFKIQLFYF